MEIISVKIAFNKEADNHKETLSSYDNKGEKKTRKIPKKKEKSRNVYVHKYEHGKHLFHSTHEPAVWSGLIICQFPKNVGKRYYNVVVVLVLT